MRFVGVLFLVWSSQALASAFDADFEPCYKEIDYSETKLYAEELLEGDKNFILFKPHTDSSIYYALNCPRRVVALQVVKDRSGKYKNATIKKALDVLGYQATFTPEAATAIIEFIKTSVDQELRGHAGFAFYYLFDHFPNISIQLDYFKKKSFKEFYLRALASENNPTVSFWFAQVAQKNAGYFYDPGNPKYCYRERFSSTDTQVGEEMAKTLLPIVARALVIHAASSSESDQITKNELLVAVNNFAYSRFLKYNAHTLKLFNDYFHIEKSKDLKEMLLRVPALSEFVNGKRTLPKNIPTIDMYCNP